MEEFFASLTAMEWIFAISAIIGGVLFFIRLVLQFVGSGSDLSDSAEIHEGFDAHMGDSDVSFKLLSLQGITGFLLMFGLVGLAMTREGHALEMFALLGALAAGLLTAWVIQKMFRTLYSFQSSGTIDMSNAVGAEGSVYLTIPPQGTGKVQLAIQERQMIFDSVSDHGEAIKTGTRVRVRNVIEGNILLVDPVEVGSLEPSGAP